MSMHASVAGASQPTPDEDFLGAYLETLSMVERLHRLLLDVVKDEFERSASSTSTRPGAPAVQRGRQRGDGGRAQDPRLLPGLQRVLQPQEARGVRLHAPPALRGGPPRGARAPTERGRQIRSIIADLFQRHAKGILSREVLGDMRLTDMNASLRRMEHYWTDQIRYIY
jgi:hypothetical protein